MTYSNAPKTQSPPTGTMVLIATPRDKDRWFLDRRYVLAWDFYPARDLTQIEGKR